MYYSLSAEMKILSVFYWWAQTWMWMLPVNYPVWSPIIYASTQGINKWISRIFFKEMIKDNVSKIKCEKESFRTDSTALRPSSSHPHIKVTLVQEALVHGKMKANKLATVTWESLKCRITSTFMSVACLTIM